VTRDKERRRRPVQSATTGPVFQSTMTGPVRNDLSSPRRPVQSPTTSPVPDDEQHTFSGIERALRLRRDRRCRPAWPATGRARGTVAVLPAVSVVLRAADIDTLPQRCAQWLRGGGAGDPAPGRSAVRSTTAPGASAEADRLHPS
jgi:hypothetical protein